LSSLSSGPAADGVERITEAMALLEELERALSSDIPTALAYLERLDGVFVSDYSSAEFERLKAAMRDFDIDSARSCVRGLKELCGKTENSAR
jgi:hypothetical protein